MAGFLENKTNGRSILQEFRGRQAAGRALEAGF
jgi:hypothetical protein